MGKEYSAHFENHYHTEEVLQSICTQRNAVLELARSNEYDWLFFLDSDILVRSDTLSLLLNSGRLCVGAPYCPRWSQVCLTVCVMYMYVCDGVLEDQPASHVPPKRAVCICVLHT